MVFIHKIGVRFSVAVQHSGVEQLVAQQAHNLKVAGSSPAPLQNVLFP
jgi:hypothetical protein